MTTPNPLRGIATVSFYAADLEAAQKWYAGFLGIEPYFNVPGYCEFRIGDYQQELGIIDSRYAPSPSGANPAGAIVYWHTDHLEDTLQRLLTLGATPYEPIIDRSGGQGSFVTASVVDPFGNVLGIMTNKHYVETLGQSSGG